jgi:hypothetical protein
VPDPKLELELGSAEVSPPQELERSLELVQVVSGLERESELGLELNLGLELEPD